MDYTTHRISLRIPVKLHKQLAHEADEASKSINAEVIARLQSSFEDSNSFDESKMKELIRQVIREELDKK